MTTDVSKFVMDWDHVRKALRQFLHFTALQMKKVMEWMVKNPEKVAVILVAVSKAYYGDVTGLVDLGPMLLA